MYSVNASSSSAVWTSTESSRAANKLTWHPYEPHTIGSAHQDGAVKLWDCRQRSGSSVVKSFAPRADAARDVAFDPFHDYLVGAAFENGQLIVWDRRSGDQPWIRLPVHLTAAQSMAWNPCCEWQLATGGRDTTFKVWDLGPSRDDSQEDGRHAEAAHALPTVGAGGIQKPLYQVHTPNVVGRIAWRGVADHPDQLATIGLADRGDVSVWRLGCKNIPACIMRGHGDETCVSFAWLDTPRSFADAYYANSVGYGGGVVGAEDGDSSALLKQHVLTVGKDGLIAVQDLRNGFFPRQHISRTVTAISARGHVAFQRSDILRVRFVSR